MKKIKCKSIVPGISIGKPFLLFHEELEEILERIKNKIFSYEHIINTIKSLRESIRQIISKLEEKKSKYASMIGFELLLVDEIEERIKKFEGSKRITSVDIEAVIKDVMEKVELEEFLVDVLTRFLLLLLGAKKIFPPKNSVVVLDTLRIDDIGYIIDNAAGVLVLSPTLASHAMIVARSLGIPILIAKSDLSNLIQKSEVLIMDAIGGYLIVNPTADEIKRYEHLKKRFDTLFSEAKRRAGEIAKTKDGVKIEVAANVGIEDDAMLAAEYGADGIGLVRTEICFMYSKSIPTWEDQLDMYQKILAEMEEKPVYFRLLDVGFDKYPPCLAPLLSGVKEKNPALGKRGVRLYEDELRDVVYNQIKALIYLSEDFNVGIFVPMVSDVSEIITVLRLIKKVKKELIEKGEIEKPSFKFGIMVETPASVVLLDKLLKFIDFVSIGTNDLTQYTLAVDRTGKYIPKYFDQAHPAILRLIKETADKCNRMGKEVSVCGEIASDPEILPILIGLGIRKISVVPIMIPILKQIIRELEYKHVKKIAEKAMDMESPQEIRELVRKELRDIEWIKILCSS